MPSWTIRKTPVWLALMLAACATPPVRAGDSGAVPPTTLRVFDGRLAFVFDFDVLHELGITVVTRTEQSVPEIPHGASFSLGDASSLTLDGTGRLPSNERDSVLRSRGAMLFGANGRTYAVGDLALHRPPLGRWIIESTLDDSDRGVTVFEIPDLLFDVSAARGRLTLTSDIALAEPLAAGLHMPEAAGRVIGSMTAEAVVESSPASGATVAVESPVLPHDPRSTAAASAGPDVIVGELYSPASYGSVDGIAAFAIGTVSCNVGNEELLWISNTNQHPVIGQNMYRLKDGRFEQIGQSWLKHGFAALTGNACGLGCRSPGTSSRLGVGCSDPYSAGLNGSQFNLGPKSEVNASTGYFPFPRVLDPPIDAVIGRRLQVHDVDLEPTLNPGAMYFIEGHYVTPDDAAADNKNNNASYRPIQVSGANGNFVIGTLGETQRELPAIEAWYAQDQSVRRAIVDVPDDGRFYVFAKATDLGGGFWGYEYAVHNLNSHRSAGSFSVPIDPQTNVTNVGFHDVDYHSGEIYDGTDWVPEVSESAVTWSLGTVEPSANALRWGTLYNFRFQADRSPTATGVTIGLWRPGDPSSVVATSIGPLGAAADCENQCVIASAPLGEPEPIIKNRFLSFVPGNTVCPTAYRVTFTALPPPFDQLNGGHMWVGEPRTFCENSGQRYPPLAGCGPSPGLPKRTFMGAPLVCQPYFTDWSPLETIHVYHEAVVPEGSYTMQAVSAGCDLLAEPSYSQPLQLPTGQWGDLVSGCTPLPCGPPDGGVHVIPDVLAIVQKFANTEYAPSKTRTELQPGRLDFSVDILDAIQGLGAFTGGDYPFGDVPTPCPD